MPNLAHYRLDGELGRGGMGVVYRAVDTRLGRPVAIKTLPTDATADPDRNRRFVQEARAASALNHPHIVTIHDIDEEAGTTFIAMELVDGTPLDRLLANGPIPVPQALEYAAQVASALQAAHAGGIVHRDIKPANIMITRDGRVKVLDFGLAKLVDRGPVQSTMTALGTKAGIILGTAAYMSPEQAEGHPVDARSDIFSLGAVLYEMLAGRRPFAGDSDIAVITSILRDDPPPLRTIRPDLPPDLQGIVTRCLAKSPERRYPDAGALRADLLAAHDRLVRPRQPASRRNALVAIVGLLLVAAVAFALWQTARIRRASWVQSEALPEIDRLQTENRPLAAVLLTRDVERVAPVEAARVRERWYPLNLDVEPHGAQVRVQPYLDVDGPWLDLGSAPLRDIRLPFAYYRVRITHPGYSPAEIAMPAPARRSVKLVPESSGVVGMVPVAAGAYTVGIAGGVELPEYWIDRLEVINRDFKRFVDAGGYRDPKYWKTPFTDKGRVLSFEEAMSRFKDSTDRTGPASWELGTFPDGRDEFPVGGISWFEAAAYAEFVGKSLPTVHQWYRAAPPEELSSEILKLSNFDSAGPLRAGERKGLGPLGTLDMGGNVKEWCVNLVTGTALRYILGGAWDEPSYRYGEPDAQDPWSRRPGHGLRLVKNVGQVQPAASAPIARVYGDPKSLVPVSDELYEIYKTFYTYDRTPLQERIESTDDSSPHWTKQKVSFDAAYAGERVPAYIFLPKNAQPPFQTVVLFPSGYSLSAASSENLDLSRFDWIVRSGRALLYPIYQGTFERRRGEVMTMNARRDLQVQWAKDFFRAVDYLDTRSDIDMDRLAYYSLSMGAYFGPIPVALDTRIKAAVFASGGLRFNYPPQIQPVNFAPRVKVPVLLISGRDDFQAPLEAQRRLLELLGTPADRKFHVPLEGGHVPTDYRGMIREVLNFLDKFLGETK